MNAFQCICGLDSCVCVCNVDLGHLGPRHPIASPACPASGARSRFASLSWLLSSTSPVRRPCRAAGRSGRLYLAKHLQEDLRQAALVRGQAQLATTSQKEQRTWPCSHGRAKLWPDSSPKLRVRLLFAAASDHFGPKVLTKHHLKPFLT